MVWRRRGVRRLWKCEVVVGLYKGELEVVEAVQRRIVTRRRA